MALAGHSAFICLNAVALPPHRAKELWEMEQPPAAPVRVLIVDDHDVFRHGLAQLLRDEGVDVVAEASGGAAGVRLATELRPDVVLMDLSMPDLSGIDAMKRIHESRPELPVVILTAHADDGVEREAREAGARGFLAKGTGLQDLVITLHEATGDRSGS